MVAMTTSAPSSNAFPLSLLVPVSVSLTAAVALFPESDATLTDRTDRPEPNPEVSPPFRELEEG